MDGVIALERAYGQLQKLVAPLGSADLVAPTPCADWDVRAMLNHTLGTAWMFVLVNQGRSAGEDAGDVVGDDPLVAVNATADANLASWREPGALDGDRAYPFGTFPAPAGLMINLGEIVLHAWDLAKATGQDASLDPEVAHAVEDFYRHVPVEVLRGHGVFGAEISVPDDAPAQDRLLAFFGRVA
jgi:uncharacterized protein (TIGR03086 family)